MSIKYSYLSIKYFIYNLYKKNISIRKSNLEDEIKLNLGCGFDYKIGWTNIDSNPACIVDLNCDFFNLDKHFEKNSVSHILMNHSISYLNLWQARDFFIKSFSLIKNDGVLEMEFPDLLKCSTIICNSKSEEEYLEAIRGIYAFDLDQIKNKESYIPYSFGWSSFFICEELKKVGFSKVDVLEPLTHGPRNWRDSRVVAYKSKNV